MNICLVSNLYPPYVIGGAELEASHQARALQAAGHRVTVITSSPAGGSCVQRPDGVRVHSLPPGNIYWAGHARYRPRALKPLWHAIDLWNPLAYRRLRTVLAGERFDLVHTHNLGGFSPAAWSAAASRGLPIVHTTHDYALTCIRAMRLRPSGEICGTPCRSCTLRGTWLRRLSRHVRAVAAPSKFVLERHLERGFFPMAKSTIVPYGIPRVLRAAPKPPADAPFRILYIGQLRRHKGVDILLQAFARFPGLEARLELAGEGELKAQCSEAAAQDSRVRLHGFVTGEEKERLLTTSHVLVLPSVWWEVVGIVLLEALAYGLPSVATRIGGIPEIVEDRVTGFLVEPGDTPVLADRLERLARDRDLVQRMSTACRVRAEQFTIERTVGRLLEVYESVRGGHL